MEDYEYYHVDTIYDMPDDLEIAAYLNALDLWERNPIPPILADYSNTLWEMFNLYYGIDPADGVYRWQLRYPYVG